MMDRYSSLRKPLDHFQHSSVKYQAILNSDSKKSRRASSRNKRLLRTSSNHTLPRRGSSTLSKQMGSSGLRSRVHVPGATSYLQREPLGMDSHYFSGNFGVHSTNSSKNMLRNSQSMLKSSAHLYNSQNRTRSKLLTSQNIEQRDQHQFFRVRRSREAGMDLTPNKQPNFHFSKRSKPHYLSPEEDDIEGDHQVTGQRYEDEYYQRASRSKKSHSRRQEPPSFRKRSNSRRPDSDQGKEDLNYMKHSYMASDIHRVGKDSFRKLGARSQFDVLRTPESGSGPIQPQMTPISKETMLEGEESETDKNDMQIKINSRFSDLMKDIEDLQVTIERYNRNSQAADTHLQSSVPHRQLMNQQSPEIQSCEDRTRLGGSLHASEKECMSEKPPNKYSRARALTNHSAPFKGVKGLPKGRKKSRRRASKGSNGSSHKKSSNHSSKGSLRHLNIAVAQSFKEDEILEKRSLTETKNKSSTSFLRANGDRRQSQVVEDNYNLRMGASQIRDNNSGIVTPKSSNLYQLEQLSQDELYQLQLRVDSQIKQNHSKSNRMNRSPSIPNIDSNLESEDAAQYARSMGMRDPSIKEGNNNLHEQNDRFGLIQSQQFESSKGGRGYTFQRSNAKGARSTSKSQHLQHSQIGYHNVSDDQYNDQQLDLQEYEQMQLNQQLQSQEKDYRMRYSNSQKGQLLSRQNKSRYQQDYSSNTSSHRRKEQLGGLEGIKASRKRRNGDLFGESSSGENLSHEGVTNRDKRHANLQYQRNSGEDGGVDADEDHFDYRAKNKKMQEVLSSNKRLNPFLKEKQTLQDSSSSHQQDTTKEPPLGSLVPTIPGKDDQVEFVSSARDTARNPGSIRKRGHNLPPTTPVMPMILNDSFPFRDSNILTLSKDTINDFEPTLNNQTYVESDQSILEIKKNMELLQQGMMLPATTSDILAEINDEVSDGREHRGYQGEGEMIV